MARERGARRHDAVRAMRWAGGALELLDQRRLPHEVVHVRAGDAASVARAIRDMVVRGAPAIGVAAAYGVVLGARRRWRESPGTWRSDLERDLAGLAAARPTAVNLAWALARMRARLAGLPADRDPEPELLAEARAIEAEDLAANRRLGALGAALIEPASVVLTHCNAGALATAGYGTALGVVRAAYGAGRIAEVLVDETRPWLQGARLTAWELAEERIPARLIADAAASYAMREAGVRWVIVGADRIAANGDVANKIGTYSLAVSARHHGVGMMVAAPSSTIDAGCPSGAEIPIEQRDPRELLTLGDRPLAAPGVGAWNPVFDVTPAELVTVLVTERGVVERPDAAGIRALLAG